MGITNIEELKKMKGQWRKDKKTVTKFKEAYAPIIEKTAIQIPAGSSTQFEIKDGVCLVSSASFRTYNTQDKKISEYKYIDKNTCDELLAVKKKHESKLNDCQKVETDFQIDLVNKMGINNSYASYLGTNGLGYVSAGGLGGIGFGMGQYQSPSMSLQTCEMMYGPNAWMTGMGSKEKSKTSDTSKQ